MYQLLLREFFVSTNPFSPPQKHPAVSRSQMRKRSLELLSVAWQPSRLYLTLYTWMLHSVERSITVKTIQICT